MTKSQFEARILRQLTYFPEFRGVAKVVLKPVVFEYKCGNIPHSEVFNYIVSFDFDAVKIINHFQNNYVLCMLTDDDYTNSYEAVSYGTLFLLLEMYVRNKLHRIVANFPPDHFREECIIFLNSEVDFFETVDTLKNFLAHYKHPGLAAVEEIALILDEKVLKIKQNHRAFQLLQQAATLLELHHPKTTIDTLFQQIYDLC